MALPSSKTAASCRRTRVSARPSAYRLNASCPSSCTAVSANCRAAAFAASPLYVAADMLEEEGLLGRRIGARQAGIDCDCPVEQKLRLGEVLAGAPVCMPQAALIEFPGAQVVGALRPCPLALCLAELGLDRADQCRRDFVLHGKDVFEVAVVALRPDMIARCAFDQLRCDTNAIACLAHAAFEHISHPELAGHLRGCPATSLCRRSSSCGRSRRTSGSATVRLSDPR